MQKQKGISTLTGIIIIVAVAVILFGGVFAYQYFTKSETQNPKSETNSNFQNIGYFEIKEVGLKFILSEDVKDLIYKVEDKGKYKEIYFSTQSLASLSPGCSFNSSVLGPLGEIIVSNNRLAPEDFYSRRLIFQNDFYVYFITPQSPCAGNLDFSANELQTKQLQSLKEVIRTITPIE